METVFSNSHPDPGIKRARLVICCCCAATIQKVCARGLHIGDRGLLSRSISAIVSNVWLFSFGK